MAREGVNRGAGWPAYADFILFTGLAFALLAPSLSLSMLVAGLAALRLAHQMLRKTQ